MIRNIADIVNIIVYFRLFSFLTTFTIPNIKEASATKYIITQKL
ncbi:hypothetical protein LM801050_380014 [Listeria monocytogenes]|nr:protein of unknown function [Listeria monocytogenes R479a]CDN71068.1 hypothetical protein LM4423_100168 [Listeria monocytogenes 4423]CUK34173.1 hypothetical protein LM500065_150205 [Listeria monocytogenes]CUK44947.1 hypothetical protein LM500401_150058 [Listeria monocytogenes]CUK73796.1 hypothetical protein LM601244_70344 [Listeria monocytogenes]